MKISSLALAAVLGGLLRAGVYSSTLPLAVLDNAAVAHAALMLSGFFGTTMMYGHDAIWKLASLMKPKLIRARYCGDTMSKSLSSSHTIKFR